MAKEKPEEQVLFPEVKVGDIVVKPWSFGMLFEVAESLDSVIRKLEETPTLLDELMGVETSISYVTIARLFTIANSEVLYIISKTLGIEEDKVRELPMEDGIRIAMLIFEMNKESIKNGVSPKSKKNQKSKA